MKENMEGSLATVQLGITLVGAHRSGDGRRRRGGKDRPVVAEHLQVSVAMAEFLGIALVVLPLTVW